MIINYLGLSLFELGRYEESIKCFDVAKCINIKKPSIAMRLQSVSIQEIQLLGIIMVSIINNSKDWHYIN